MSAGENKREVSSATDLAVNRELICLLYGSPSVPLINGILALVTAGVLWRIFPLWASLPWLIVSFCIVLIRLILWSRFNKRGPDTGGLAKWGRRFTVATAITGVLWGLVASTTFVAPEPIYYLFAAFVVAGLSAGAAIRLSPHLPAFYALIGTGVPPMVLSLLMRGHMIPFAMGGLLVTFLLAMNVVARENHQRLTDYIRMKIEQELLNADLKKVTLNLEQQIAENRRRESDLTTIARLSDMLQSCGKTTEAYPIIADSAATLFPLASGCFAIVSAETRGLVQVTAWGPDQSWALPRFREEDCQALRAHREYESNGSAVTVRCRHLTAVQGKRCLCLPLKDHGKTHGLVSLMVAEGSGLDDATRRVLHSFAEVVKLSLANLQLRESLAEQAFCDPLTGLFNRRYLMETMPREVRRAQRRGAPVTIALLDIDHFKQFNDQYGHDAGDFVLAELAAQFAGDLRAEDIACRYGGEEFLFLLPDCDLASAYQRMTEISLKARSRPNFLRGKRLPNITLSIGLATLSNTLSTSESLITAADEAMYAAKRMGRDRIECFEASSQSRSDYLPSK
jgi:diguanylate cyclase (GGDEF)-like protein